MEPDREDATGPQGVLATASARLVDAVDAAFDDWVVGAVRRYRNDLDGEALAAAAGARGEVVAELRALVGAAADAQRSTPLTVLRRAARVPTAVLAAAGVPTPERDEFSRRVDPDDVYGVAVATWADLGADVAEAGLVWGAAKAHAHLRSRSAGEGAAGQGG